MLVSMVLLSMVLLIASNAYSLFSDRWNGRLGHFNQSVTNAKQLILVQESLKSVISYVVTNDENKAKMYFEGNRNGFVAVTLKSLFTPQVAAVMRIQITQNSDFTYTLTYQEAAMTERLLTKARQTLSFSKPIVLFDNLTNIEFQYFGWPSTENKYWQPDGPTLNRKPKAWFNEYNSLEKSLQPEQIKITFTNSLGSFILQVKLNDSVPNALYSYSVKE
jgi:hypothetical protein